MNSTFIKYLVINFLIIIISGCATTSENYKKKDYNPIADLSKQERQKIALRYVIDGNIMMISGNYGLALKQFESALNYDTSGGICFALAKAYLYNSKLNLALQFANKSIELDSNSLDYYLLLSDIYNFGKQKLSAIEVLEKATEKFPDNYSLIYKLANLYEENRPLRSIELYEKLLKIFGSEWNLLARITELHSRLGNISDEIFAFERLLKIDPGNKNIINNLIDLYLIQKRNEEAINLIDELLELNPNDFSTRQRKIELYLNEKNWSKVYDEIKILVNNETLDFQIQMDLGYFFFERSFRDTSALSTAKYIFEKLDKDTSYWQVKLVLGAIAINQGEEQKAIEYFKYVTENAIWNVDAWIKLGALHFDNKKYFEAKRIMLEAVELFPNDYFVNFILGLSLAQLSENDNALVYLKKSIDLNPRDVQTINAYAFTLIQLKQQDSAIVYLNRALTISPDEVDVLGSLAMIYNEKHLYEKSDSLYERALLIKPDDPIINNNYAYSLSTRGLQLDRALEMVNLSLQKDSLNSAFLDTKGWILYKLNRYQEAKYYVEKAIEVGTQSAVITDHLGDIEYKLGNIERAIELWKKALEIDPAKTEIEQKIIKGGI